MILFILYTPHCFEYISTHLKACHIKSKCNSLIGVLILFSLKSYFETLIPNYFSTININRIDFVFKDETISILSYLFAHVLHIPIIIKIDVIHFDFIKI